MPRTPIVAGNWKMNLTAPTARDLVQAIRYEGVDDIEDVEKILCPPFPYLAFVEAMTVGSSLKVGAQDMHWLEKGAFTGAVSPVMIREFAEYVIIGHSERRALFGETDESVNQKLKAAFAHDLIPILCVGETGDQRQAGQTNDVLQRQVRGALEALQLPATAIIAYEPVWAIGTGLAATTEDANGAIGFIRDQLAQLQGAGVASTIRILYGGSVTPANIADFVAQPEVDGGLVGGASLVAESFVQMVRNVADLKDVAS